MMRSLFSGVSGLSNHQVKMDVIGNNIANVNTVGFKAGKVSFQDIFSQSIRGASASNIENGGRGGVNPMQIGLGMAIGAINNNFSSGSLQRTDSNTDLAIDGEGFFIVQGSDGSKYNFTRAGNFQFDEYGNLVTPNGSCVYGWQTYKLGSTTEFDVDVEVQPLNIYDGNLVLGAEASTIGKMEGNLSSAVDALVDITFNGNPLELPENFTMEDIQAIRQSTVEIYASPITVYDSLGNDINIKINFIKTDTDVDDDGNQTTIWSWYAMDDETQRAIDNFVHNEQLIPPGITNSNAKKPAIDPATVIPSSGTIIFDSKGALISVEPSSTTADNPFSISLMGGPSADIADDGTMTLNATGPNGETLIPSQPGARPINLDIDFTAITQFKADSSVKNTQMDGNPMGSYVSCEIGSDGTIMGIYSNGKMKSLGVIGMATFPNPSGLKKTGGNLFVTTANSGEFTKAYPPGRGSAGYLAVNMLEMSNVDLSSEFVDMITTQRGFQANSRVISTSDEMLQELVNLKR